MTDHPHLWCHLTDIGELRLGPLESQSDLSLAAQELADKENEVIRALLVLAARKVTWDDVQDKPEVFPPDLSEIPSSGGGQFLNSVLWVNVEDVPTDLEGFRLLEEVRNIVLARLVDGIGTHNADETNVHGIANTAALVLTSDSRLSDSRSPTAHATSHYTTDVLDVDLIPAPDGFNATKLYGNATLDLIDVGVAYINGGEIGAQMSWTGGSEAFLSGLPAGSAEVLNLNAARVGGLLPSAFGRLSLGNFWNLAQVFSAAASFQGPTVPFVVVGTDRVDNLNTEKWDGLGRGTTGQVVLGVTAAAPVYGQVDNSHILGAAAIAWSKISKTGASLADIPSGVLPKAQQNAQTAYLDVNNLFVPLQTFGGGLMITGGSSNTGRIWKDATDGLAARGVAGSTNSLRILNELGQTVFAVPVGTQTANFPGSLSSGGTIGAAGVATFSTSGSFGGLLTLSGGAAIAGGGSGAGRLWSDAVAGLAMRGITGSTNCFEVRNDSNAAVLRIAAGSTTVKTTSALEIGTDLSLVAPTTATTVGAAGAASALPATPVGYLVVNIAGTNRKIPYYAM